MKTWITVAVIFSTMMLVSCVKIEKKSTAIDLPKIQKYSEPIVIKKSGFKCDISGEAENKEIFLEITKKENKTSVRFYDFISATKISTASAKFEGFTLMSISLSENADDSDTLEGDGILLHSDSSSLSDEGKVISVTGKLILNKDMSGLIQKKLLISKEDNSIQSTDFNDLAKIENCEEFEAIWI